MTSKPMSEGTKRLLGVVLYPGFEPLDVCGPVNLFAASGAVETIYIAEKTGPVTSVTGAMTWVASHSFQDIVSPPPPPPPAAAPPPAPGKQQQIHRKLDWLLVPGGIGSRTEVNNPKMIKFLQHICDPAYGLQLCMSVCTGSPILASAGLLDGRKATSNKNVFDWASKTGKDVTWLRQARWVGDGMYVTSSGVTAGADMAVYVLKQQFGADVAAAAAKYNEYIPHTNADEDPFADSSFVPEV